MMQSPQKVQTKMEVPISKILNFKLPCIHVACGKVNDNENCISGLFLLKRRVDRKPFLRIKGCYNTLLLEAPVLPLKFHFKAVAEAQKLIQNCMMMVNCWQNIDTPQSAVYLGHQRVQDNLHLFLYWVDFRVEEEAECVSCKN